MGGYLIPDFQYSSFTCEASKTGNFANIRFTIGTSPLWRMSNFAHRLAIDQLCLLSQMMLRSEMKKVRNFTIIPSCIWLNNFSRNMIAQFRFSFFLLFREKNTLIKFQQTHILIAKKKKIDNKETQTAKEKTSIFLNNLSKCLTNFSISFRMMYNKLPKSKSLR